jgi:hypothetical protein
MATEDTQSNDALIEEMVQNVQGTKRGESEVIHKGDGDLPAPMVVTRVKDEGLVTIYDKRTGEASLALKYMLRTLLAAKNPDGTFRFTAEPPKVSFKGGGTYKCLLHPDDPNRAVYDTLGFPVCKKSNLTSPYMVKKHMKSRHPTVWGAIEDERKEKERQEDRELQRTIISQAKPKETEKAPLYVSDRDKKKAKKI